MDRFKKKTEENGERTSLKIKISMRKTAKMIAVVSCTILMLAACSPKKEVISQSVTGNEDKTYDSGEWIVQKNGSLIQNAGGNHSDYQTLLLKIFANIIRILMPFPVTLGILSIVLGISIFTTQMK